MAGLLDGKVALVTGGSRGIGRATAIELASSGASVAVNYNANQEAADEVVNAITSAGGKAGAYQFNIADRAAVDSQIDQIVSDLGPVTVLVNNAGATADRTLRNMSDEQWDSVIEVNLTGTFNVTKKIWNIMGEAGGGHIVNISSIVGEAGRLGLINYSTAKAGLLGFTKTAAKEGARTNIQVNAIAPGFIDTDMISGLTPEMKENLKKEATLGRLGEVEEIAKVVRFIVSEATYMTGATIDVNGGMYYR
ncbi:MAG: 3-oxoacyl-ACP reductase FabG [Chloroflexi bacterium]|nr:3-oxoacyl-ACP reductase FabG [Chloroflexota bacterium]